MRRVLRYRPSPAMGVALVALFIALSAGAAANLPGIGVVNSGDIKNNTVRSKDIRNNTVRSKDVRDSSLLAKDFKAGQLPAGPQGPQGETGATGLQGPAGPVNLVYRKGTSNPIASTTSGFAVGCPASAPNAIGGGFETSSTTTNLRLFDSRPTDGGDPDGIPDDNWEVIVYNPTATPETITVYAVCTAATSVAQAPDEL